MDEAETIIQGLVECPRLGMKNVKKHQYLAKFNGVSSRGEAARLLLGKKAVCLVGRRKILGRIIGLHGKNGVVRIRFTRGLPEPSKGLPIMLLKPKARQPS